MHPPHVSPALCVILLSRALRHGLLIHALLAGPWIWAERSDHIASIVAAPPRPIGAASCGQGTKRQVKVLETGAFFGEVALINHAPRAADCVAASKLKVRKLMDDDQPDGRYEFQPESLVHHLNVVL